eukprot:TRINITY_DN91931_c0_g1_i1.p1 TRINITY_DN91931_c0_g1~~TRINITY_DN91931_c0_g1_i1.p1  ORF type:complete len:382 (+),score=83.22 TRINITY_DN91931_c0_g1_i1:49-1194(+)
MGRLSAALLCVILGHGFAERPDAKRRLQSVVATAKGSLLRTKETHHDGRRQDSTQAYGNNSSTNASNSSSTTASSSTTTSSNTTTSNVSVVEVWPPSDADALIVTQINESQTAAVAAREAIAQTITAGMGKVNTSITTANSDNMQRLEAYSKQQIEFEQALNDQIASLTGPHAERMASYREIADAGEAERNMMQSTLNFVKNGLTRKHCPPPDFASASGATQKVKIHVPGESPTPPLLGGRRFTTFEVAWRLCGETPGCGQIVKQEGTGTATINGENKTLADEYNGFALRRNSDKDFEQGISVAAGDGSVTYTGVAYACSLLCPAVCQDLTRGTVCQTCASSTKRECSACDPEDTTRNGCSGNCGVTFVDCRACSGLNTAQ